MALKAIIGPAELKGRKGNGQKKSGIQSHQSSINEVFSFPFLSWQPIGSMWIVFHKYLD